MELFCNQTLLGLPQWKRALVLRVLERLLPNQAEALEQRAIQCVAGRAEAALRIAVSPPALLRYDASHLTSVAERETKMNENGKEDLVAGNFAGIVEWVVAAPDRLDVFESLLCSFFIWCDRPATLATVLERGLA
jgi:hypothetical protein